MSEDPSTQSERTEASEERLETEEGMRYPRHEDPDAARDDVGLDGERGRQGEPEGAPRPAGGQRGTPTPSAGEQAN